MVQSGRGEVADDTQGGNTSFPHFFSFSPTSTPSDGDAPTPSPAVNHSSPIAPRPLYADPPDIAADHERRLEEEPVHAQTVAIALAWSRSQARVWAHARARALHPSEAPLYASLPGWPAVPEVLPPAYVPGSMVGVTLLEGAGCTPLGVQRGVAEGVEMNLSSGAACCNEDDVGETVLPVVRGATAGGRGIPGPIRMVTPLSLPIKAARTRQSSEGSDGGDGDWLRLLDRAPGVLSNNNGPSSRFNTRYSGNVGSGSGSTPPTIGPADHLQSNSSFVRVDTPLGPVWEGSWRAHSSGDITSISVVADTGA